MMFVSTAAVISIVLTCAAVATGAYQQLWVAGLWLALAAATYFLLRWTI